MIGFLRFVGLLNTAVWLGATIFFTSGAWPAAYCAEMKDLLGARNYPYFSEAVGQIVFGKYFQLQMVCGGVALLHILAEWLYLGRSAQRFWLGLLIGLCALSLIGGCWVQPRMKALHAVKYGANTPPETREAASSSFLTWRHVFHALNVVMIGGLALYLWRVANPADRTRFLDAAKVRS